MFFCKSGEYLSVDFDIFCFKCVDECAVAHTFFTYGGIDLGLPKRSIIPLLLFSSLKGMRPCMEKRFFCGAFFAFSSPLKPFGIAEKFFPFFVGYGTSFNSSHGLFFIPKYLILVCKLKQGAYCFSNSTGNLNSIFLTQEHTARFFGTEVALS